MNINIFKLSDFHQVNPLLGDVIFDALLELFPIADAFDGIAFTSGVYRDAAAEFTRLVRPLFNRHIYFLIAALFLDRSSGQSQTALKGGPDMIHVAIFRKD